MNGRGIALLMGLVLLSAISLVAVMAANGMVLQRRMSANFGDDYRALARAATATKAARDWLESRADSQRERGCASDCILPVAVLDNGTLPHDPEFQSTAWWRANATAAGSHPETGEPLGPEGVADDPPMWIIEEMEYVPLSPNAPEAGPAGIAYCRILALSGADRPGRQTVTETIVARPWDGDYQPLPYPPEQTSPGFCSQFSDAIPCGTLAWRQRR